MVEVLRSKPTLDGRGRAAERGNAADARVPQVEVFALVIQGAKDQLVLTVCPSRGVGRVRPSSSCNLHFPPRSFPIPLVWCRDARQLT